MKFLGSFGIVVGSVLGAASAAGASQAVSLPGAAATPSPMLAVGAFISAAVLWKVISGIERPRRMRKTVSASELAEVVLPKAADRSRELASWQDFVVRLQSFRQDDRQSAPLLFVRLDGVDETRRRYGCSVADRIMIGTAHRLRAHLRRDDTVVNFLPGELFILLSGDISDEDVRMVVRRLEAVLATPIPSIKRRHARLVTATVQVSRATFTNGRLQILAGDAQLVDAPLPPVDLYGPPARRHIPERRTRNAGHHPDCTYS